MLKPAQGARLAAALLFVSFAPACSEAASTADSGGVDVPVNELIPGRRVMIIGLDGVRPDALQQAATPHMDRLIANGAVSFSASTHLTGITSSGPGWTSILTGVEVEKHNVTFNGLYDNIDRAFPTVTMRAQELLGARISMTSHWPDIVVGITEPEARGEYRLAFDKEVSEHVAEVVGLDQADLYFVQFDDIDDAGHTTGFDAANSEYIDAIELTDSYVGTIIDAVAARPADEEWLFLMTTDHGGEGTQHGAQNAANRTIWVIVSADGVIQGKLSNATHMDLHPTALRWLGAQIDPVWELDGSVQGLPTE